MNGIASGRSLGNGAALKARAAKGGGDRGEGRRVTKGVFPSICFVVSLLVMGIEDGPRKEQQDEEYKN